MIKELLLSVDISNRDSVIHTITYLYSIMPRDPAAEAEDLAGDLALMNLDYRKGDPYSHPATHSAAAECPAGTSFRAEKGAA